MSAPELISRWRLIGATTGLLAVAAYTLLVAVPLPDKLAAVVAPISLQREMSSGADIVCRSYTLAGATANTPRRIEGSVDAMRGALRAYLLFGSATRIEWAPELATKSDCFVRVPGPATGAAHLACRPAPCRSGRAPSPGRVRKCHSNARVSRSVP